MQEMANAITNNDHMAELSKRKNFLSREKNLDYKQLKASGDSKNFAWFCGLPYHDPDMPRNNPQYLQKVTTFIVIFTLFYELCPICDKVHRYVHYLMG